MADSSSGRSPLQVSPPGEGAVGGLQSQRQENGEEQITFAPAGQISDETPTIISKNKPGTGDNVQNSLRGRTLAHFELIEPIGVGGMAAVLRARDKELDRIVALKILPPEMAADPENVQRFHQEARAAAKLDHENIARVFYCGEDQHLHFIAFEYVEGENLRTILERHGRLPVPEAVRYILQIAAGLEHAASRGVVHRDIKPSNIIISPSGRAKLVDMGLARSLGRRDGKGLTQSGVTLGTFDYLSPEQALEPREADVRSDIYSLGCTFYHVLTGQPPVPEGTAAKKLHHHQHVAPVDPRQLNPDIPDEVAIILHRMMAKDPRERYQHPVHLIHHLMQVAQKVGAGADVPEGVMFVDAPLPEPPRKRPLLVISLAAFALGVVLTAISLTPPLRTIVTSPRPGLGNQNESGQGAKDQSPAVAVKPSVLPYSSAPRSIISEHDLAKAMAEEGSTLHLQVANKIEITEPNLRFQGEGDAAKNGRSLILESKDALEPQTVRIKYPSQSRPEMPEWWAGLVIDGGTVTFRNVVFEITGSGPTPDIPVTAVLVRHSATVTFDSCKFVQKDIPPRSFLPQAKHMIPVASVAIDHAHGTGDKPTVRFDKCYFQEGQVAVSLHGTGDIYPTDCAFGPHCALFHLRGESKNFASRLELLRCSAMVVRGPAFRLDDEASCQLRITHSLFSRPEHTPDKRYDQPDLIRQTDSQNTLVRFAGKCNAYHNLNAFWVLPTGNGSRLVTTLEEFRELVSQTNGYDDGTSRHLLAKVNPWRSATPLKETDKAAFEVNKDLEEVRQLEKKNRPLGIAWGPGWVIDDLPDLSPPAPVVVAPKPHEKIVDPEAEAGVANVFRRISQALTLAEPGDVILIKHRNNQREMEVDPVRLDKMDADILLKPFPGYSPILVLGDTTEKDAAFFRLQDGKLQLEGLDIRLEPKIAFKAQSVVLVGGNGSCTLKNCAVTLRPLAPEDSPSLSVVTLVDLDDTMKMPQVSLRLYPEIRFHNCLVRGEGDLVTVRASRALDLDIDNSLLALTGSALDMAAQTRDVSLQPGVTLRLSSVSAFMSEPFLQMRTGKTGRGLVFTRIERARNCLFVALANKPLVHLQGLEASEQRMRDFLEWNAERNAYCGFDKLLEQQPGDDFMMPLRFDKDGWRLFTGESDPKFLRAKFDLPPWPDNPLSQVLPEHLMPKTEYRGDLQNYGAAVDANHLPTLGPPRQPESIKEDDGE